MYVSIMYDINAVKLRRLVSIVSMISAGKFSHRVEGISEAPVAAVDVGGNRLATCPIWQFPDPCPCGCLRAKRTTPKINGMGQDWGTKILDARGIGLKHHLGLYEVGVFLVR